MKNINYLHDPKYHAINQSCDSKSKLQLQTIFIKSCGIHKVLKNEHKIFRPNGRVDYQIIFIKTGSAHFFLNGEERIIPEGNIVLYRPYQPQEYCYHSCENCEVFWIHFNGDNIESLLEECNFVNGSVFYVGLFTEYIEFFNDIIFEIASELPFFENKASSHFLSLLFLFARNYLKKDESNISAIWPAILALQQEYMFNYEISKYAKICHLSYSRFTHLFTSSVGRSPLAYRQNLRIEHAKESLKTTLQTVQEISDSVGFSDQKYFSSFFKKCTGYTPSDYRAKHRKHLDPL